MFIQREEKIGNAFLEENICNTYWARNSQGLLKIPLQPGEKDIRKIDERFEEVLLEEETVKKHKKMLSFISSG